MAGKHLESVCITAPALPGVTECHCYRITQYTVAAANNASGSQDTAREAVSITSLTIMAAWAQSRCGASEFSFPDPEVSSVCV